MRHTRWSAHALPLSDRLFQEPFYLTHAGWESVAPYQPYPLSGHPAYYSYDWTEGRVLGEFCLWLLTEGEGEIETNKGRQKIRSGQACLYLPGEWHRHRPKASVGWHNQWINFNGSLAHRWMEDGAFALSGNLVQVEDADLFARQFRHLVDSVNTADGRNSLQFSWQAIGLLSHFLSDVHSGDLPSSSHSGDPLVDAVRAYIWSQSHNRIGIGEVVVHTGVTRRTLERRFRQVTGTTLLKEINQCRLSRAELLLRDTQAPIKYVIGRAGFSSYQHMRLAFQKVFGFSPEQYRLNAKS